MVSEAKFCERIEKRIRKYVRINKIFSKGDKLIVVGDVCRYLVGSIIKGLPVTIVYRRRVGEVPKGYRVVMPWTMDDEIVDFLESVFLNKKRKKHGFIKLLVVATDKEIKQFARFKKLEFKENSKNKDIKEFLDKLEEEHPETKHSLLKSVEQIEKIYG
jgi:hypothetical protein